MENIYTYWFDNDWNQVTKREQAYYELRTNISPESLYGRPTTGHRNHRGTVCPFKTDIEMTKFIHAYSKRVSHANVV